MKIRLIRGTGMLRQTADGCGFAPWNGRRCRGDWEGGANLPLFSPLQRASRPTPKGPLFPGTLWDAGCDTLLRGASEKVYGPILGTDSPLLRCSSYVAWLRAWDSSPRRREAPATSQGSRRSSVFRCITPCQALRIWELAAARRKTASGRSSVFRFEMRGCPGTPRIA